MIPSYSQILDDNVCLRAKNNWDGSEKCSNIKRHDLFVRLHRLVVNKIRIFFSILNTLLIVVLQEFQNRSQVFG